MHTLPWLLVHGPLVWPVALLALAAVALATALLRPRITARWRARSARDRLGAPTPWGKPTDDVRVTLSGVLEAEGAPCHRFEDGGEAAAASASYTLGDHGGAWLTGVSARADRLSLRVGEVKIALEGPLEVLAGSREVQRREPLSRMAQAIQDRVAEQFISRAPHFRDHVTALRSVAHGDTVRVTGVLRRDVEAAEVRGYRAAQDRWKLVPDGDEIDPRTGLTSAHGMRLAFEGPPRIEGPRALPWVGAHVAIAVAIGAVGLALTAEIAFSSAAEAKDGAPPSMSSTSLAATAPWRREGSLRALARAMDLLHEEREISIDQRAALHTLAGDCSAAAEALAWHGRFRHGADVAAQCGDHLLAAKLSYIDGDFARASASLARAAEPRRQPGSSGRSDADARFIVRVHLLAGDAQRAAIEAREISASFAASAGDSPEGASRAALARCLADALDARSGSREARERLEKERERPLHTACAILLADLAQGQARLDLIHSMKDLVAGEREAPAEWLELLAMEANPKLLSNDRAPDVLWTPSLLVIHPTHAIAPMLPAVERAIAEDATRGAARARTAAIASAFSAATGDFESARRLVKITRDASGPQDSAFPRYEPARAAALASAIELTAGGPARAAELLAAAESPFGDGVPRDLQALVRYRSQRAANELGYFFFATWHIREEGIDRAMMIAARGDGAALTALLQQPSSEPGAYLRLAAPLIETGKGDLLHWIRLGYRVPGWFRSPAAAAIHETNLAAAATALGDDPLATALQDRASRFRKALLRRDLAVPLAMIERL